MVNFRSNPIVGFSPDIPSGAPATSGGSPSYSSGSSRSGNFLSNVLSYLPGIGSVAGGLLNFFSQKSTNRAAAREAERNRQFNAAQAKLQRDWTERMWSLNNQYNSPSAQMQRLSDAGLNPNLAYGSLSESSATAATGGSAASSSSLPSFTAPQLSFDSAATAKLLAETRNINQDTNKKAEETSILASDARFRDALNSGEVELNSVNVLVGNSVRDLNRGQLALLKPQFRNLELQGDVLVENIANIKALTSESEAKAAGQRIDNYFNIKSVDIRLKQLYALYRQTHVFTNLSYAQYKEIIQMLPLKKYNMSEDSYLKYVTSGKISAETQNAYIHGDLEKKIGAWYDSNTQRVQFDLSVDKTWKQAMAELNYCNEWLRFQVDFSRYMHGEHTTGFKLGPFQSTTTKVNRY